MKIISVPIDKLAEERLFSDLNIEGDSIDIYLNEYDYKLLWRTSFFHEINNTLNIIIDDFEEEDVKGKENLYKLHAIIISFENKISNPIIPTLKSLTEAAIRFDTGVYFFS